ncbi:hypothetical protein Tco_1581660 [Tanacetum coccineum]
MPELSEVVFWLSNPQLLVCSSRLKLYEKEKKWIDDFKPIDDDSQHQAESTKKRPRADSEEESSKKRKLEEDNDVEKEELRDNMDVVPRGDVAIDRADGSSKNDEIFSEMLDDFDRQDVIDLHSLVNERYEITSPYGYDFSCTVDEFAIHMMIEKKYPLTQEMLSRMLNRRLEVDYEFTRSQLQK